MSEQEIIEGNKLIAKFVYNDSFIDDGDGCCYCELPNGMVDFYIEDAKYHSSWDWLMPVVEKVTSLIQEKLYIPVGKYKEYEEQHNLYEIQWRKLFHYQSYNFFKAGIESIYKAIVEFIKWYNSCQKE